MRASINGTPFLILPNRTCEFPLNPPGRFLLCYIPLVEPVLMDLFFELRWTSSWAIEEYEDASPSFDSLVLLCCCVGFTVFCSHETWQRNIETNETFLRCV